MKTVEVNFDGIVGPTHNYAGLSYGNVASMANYASISKPKQAAWEGLQKMWFLHRLGIPQAVLPPQARPDIGFLRRLGFTGNPADILSTAYDVAPQHLHQAYSASSMWAANAATVSPSADCADGKVHFTPANLISTTHRSLEPPFTAALLRNIFSSEKHFVHHDPLPSTLQFSDEGAANHMRVAAQHGDAAVEIFVYGQSGQSAKTQQFPARQNRDASWAVARAHKLAPKGTLFVQQHPDVIDAGVFHNDVIAVANENFLLLHEQSWLEQTKTIKAAKEKLDLQVFEVAEAELSVKDAVRAYLFNSQIVTLPNGGMAIIAPKECEDLVVAKKVLQRIKSEENPVSEVHYLDVRESMKNGGGPACLRLRVVLTEEERNAVHPHVFLTEELYHQLAAWIDKYYREALAPDELVDPQLVEESYQALDALTQILKLGSIYPFQR